MLDINKGDDMTAIPRKKQVDCHQGRVESLLAEVLEGSETAFQQIILLEQQRVRVYLARYVFSADQIDDIAQDVFITAYRRLETFRFESKFSTWLLAIARNKAMQFLRTEIRRRRRQQNYLESTVVRQRLEQAESEKPARELERIDALRDCLEKLPSHGRNMIDKFYFQKISTSQIAEAESKNNGAIRMKLFRIRQKLANCVKLKISDQS